MRIVARCSAAVAALTCCLLAAAGCSGAPAPVQARMVPAEAAGESVAFGGGALKGLKAGTGYVYRLVVDKGNRSPTAAPTESNSVTRYVRVLVTEVHESGGAVALKGRLDELDDHGKLLHGDLYPFILIARDDGSDVTLTTPSSAGSADVLGAMESIPFLLLGYPDFGSAPKNERAAPVVRNNAAGAMVARFTPTYDAGAQRLEVSVERFRYAGEDDAAKGRQVLYWVKDAQQLTPTVPAGQEAAPLYAPGGGSPKDKGALEKFNVRPVVANAWEKQVWEPGAPFPRVVTYSAPEDGTGFEARLLLVQHLVPAPGPAGDHTQRSWADSGEGRGWRNGDG